LRNGKNKSQRRCKICNTAGHNSRTCSQRALQFLGN
jgi:hypothetical protein